jgi:energy-coupling factor transporter ATP-binding protein EcfA2
MTNTAIYTVTEAKASLGDLISKAEKGESVFIRTGKGKQTIVQLVRAVIPEPIPFIPPGGLDVTADQVALHELVPINDGDILKR